MPMNPTVRQRRYRERHLGTEGQKVRLQCMLSVRANAQLARLAAHHRYSVTTLIETLAADAERALLDTLSQHDMRRYLDGPLHCNGPSS